MPEGPPCEPRPSATIRDRSGLYQVLEVNSMPAWSALQSVHSADITAAIARAFVDRLLAEQGQVTGQSLAERSAGP